MAMEQYVQENSESQKKVLPSKSIEQSEMGPKEKNVPLNAALELKNKDLFKSCSDAIISKDCSELNKTRETLNTGLNLQNFGYAGKVSFKIENNKLVLNDTSMEDFGDGNKQELTAQKAALSLKNGKIYFEGLYFSTYISIDNQGKMIAGSTLGEDPLTTKRVIGWVNAIPYIGNAWDKVIFPQIRR